MRRLLLTASATSLSLLLAACGSGGNEAESPAAPAASEAAATPAASGTAPADPAASATPGATPTASATPGATPSATPSASASAAARPTQAAATPAAPPAAFTTCGVCHSVQPGQHMIGPSLAGVVGRRAGTASGYSAYSPAMRGANVTWNDGTLDRYLADPAAVVPGGSMPAPGVDAAQRRAIIAYLKTI